MEDLDTGYCELVTCPWCGYKERDSWEYEDGEYECNSCGKPIEIYRIIDVHFSTAKVIKEEKQNV